MVIVAKGIIRKNRLGKLCFAYTPANYIKMGMNGFIETEIQEITALLKLALAEDHVSEDATSLAIFSKADETIATLTARQEMVFAGELVLPLIFPPAGGGVYINYTLHVKDGQTLSPGTKIATISGSTRDILALERTLLNILQRLCGVATLTQKYVAAVSGTRAKILDTRKTIPGWRALDKYAVRCGGGVNHRMHLADAMMIKDNHIAASGGLKEAVSKAYAYKEQARIPLIVECDTLEQLEELLALPTGQVDRALLDNMPPEMLRKAVALTDGKLTLEASGGITLEIIGNVAKTGVDFISVGAITHSAVAVDIGLDK